MRLDKFLQVSRLVRRRTLAQALCDGGRVRVNGTAAKPSTAVRPGDVITVVQGDRRLMAKVLRIPERPTPAKGLVELLGRITLDELKDGTRGPGPGTRD